MRRHRRIGAFTPGSDLNLLLLGGGAIAIYFIGKNFGIWGSASNNTDGPSATAKTPSGNTTPQAAATDQQNFAAQGQTPKFSQAQYAAFADTIFSAGNTALPMLSSPSTVLAILNQMDDPIDMSMLVQAFGTRTVQVFWSMDLYTFINRAFSASDIASFNQQLLDNGITQYQF